VQTDLRLAKQRLKQKSLTLVTVKRGKVIFETEIHGISGLLKAIEEHGEEMKGSSVSDRIVGRAAALLCVYSGVVAVFAITASDEGIEVLRKGHVSFEFEQRVSFILNSEGTDICPFEKLASKFSSPKEAYEGLKTACG